MTATLRILGVPAPQGSKTAVVRGGHARLIEGSSKSGREAHKAWRLSVAAEAEAHVWRHGPVGDGPVQVRVQFRMPKPKSRAKYVRWADRKPDIDKLVRSTLDGLADGGLLAHGDSRVARLDVEQVYVVPGEWSGAVVDAGLLEHGEARLWPVPRLEDSEVPW